MYAVLKFNAGATQAQMGADVVAVIGGETDVNNLSAGCDKANSSISVAYDNAGWSVYDATAGTNKQVLRAPCNDDPTQYKYAVVDYNNSGYIALNVVESWNNSTHVGTNYAYSALSTNWNRAPVSTSLATTVYLSASNRRIAMWGTYTGVASTALALVLECDTAFTWCGAGQGFVPVCALAGPNQTQVYMPRYIGKDGSTYSQNSSNFNTIVSSMGGTSWAQLDSTPGSGAPMGGGLFATPITPIFPNYGSSQQAPMISGFSLTDIYWTPGVGSMLDEVPYNGKTYVMWNTTNSGTSGKFLVPKG